MPETRDSASWDPVPLDDKIEHFESYRIGKRRGLAEALEAVRLMGFSLGQQQHATIKRPYDTNPLDNAHTSVLYLAHASTPSPPPKGIPHQKENRARQPLARIPSEKREPWSHGADSKLCRD